MKYHYGYPYAPCGIVAFYNLATGESIWFDKADDAIDSAKERIRQEEHSSICKEKSKHTGLGHMRTCVIIMVAMKMIGHVRNEDRNSS